MDHKVPWPGVPFRVVSKVQSPFDLSFDELFDIDLPGTNFQYLEFGKSFLDDNYSRRPGPLQTEF